MGIKRVFQIQMNKCVECKTYVFVRDLKNNLCLKCREVIKSELVEGENNECIDEKMQS